MVCQNHNVRWISCSRQIWHTLSFSLTNSNKNNVKFFWEDIDLLIGATGFLHWWPQGLSLHGCNAWLSRPSPVCSQPSIYQRGMTTSLFFFGNSGFSEAPRVSGSEMPLGEPSCVEQEISSDRPSLLKTKIEPVSCSPVPLRRYVPFWNLLRKKKVRWK